MSALVHLVLSGVIPCTINNRTYLIQSFDNLTLYLSQEIYEKTYRRAQLTGVLTDAEIVKQMIRMGEWSLLKTGILDSLPKQLEQLKVDLYKAYINFKSRDRIIKKIENTKKQIVELSTQRYYYRDMTCEGIAELTQKKWTIKQSTFDKDGNPIDDEDNTLKKLVSAYYDAIPSEQSVRKMIRGEQWRSYWNASKTEGSLFGVPACKLNEIQRSVLTWARIYDNMYEHPECPSDIVIADNDMMDGWLITQQRQRAGEKLNVNGGNQETFVLVDSPEDAKRVDNMMDPSSRFIKQQRMKQLKKQGVVNEEDMFDSKLTIRNKSNG